MERRGALLVCLATVCTVVVVLITSPDARRAYAIHEEVQRLRAQGWTDRLGIGAAERECIARQVQSQGLEDLRMLEMLLIAGNISAAGKTFVELGAFDGKTYSNTWVLEHCFGWHGLLIEGSPDNFAALRRNRPNPKNALRNLAVCAEDARGYVDFSARGSQVSGDESAMSRSFKNEWGAHHGSGSVRVPCQPLSRIMRESNMESAAFLSLDVEGSELKVIETVDPTVFGAILIEVSGHDVRKDFRVHRLVQRAGMLAPFGSMGCRKKHCGGAPQPLYIGGNDVYLAPSVMDAYVERAVS